ncbi:homoserine kinase [Sporolactobacillus sp. CQH2019]|uniref:homoserine kinase n=1 Tax=Sporolactobacillus sp. CQH2019 TaxID=3023512 RepID=UPI002367F02F|nr:homoserine kinase [Sporolactobacillus sp. CQH2019]MDD9147446.1 homoserine kinase [Sporolactobacillus sp. CQH2019]
MNTSAFQIRVPGSTANLGPGFDSIGLALNRFLVLNARQADEWQFHYLAQPEFQPRLSDNLIYLTAKRVAESRRGILPPYSVDVRSDIPIARGLGSSGAAIIAGIELADFLLDLRLSIEEKAWIACKIEGHPDNVTASLFGGLVVSTQSETGVHSARLSVPEFDFVALIPSYELKTSDARNVLPSSLAFRDAIEGSSIANVLICALLTGNGELAGKMMERDRFHQPYRAPLIPNLEKISCLAREAGAYGTFLSGAGPALMSLTPKTKSAAVRASLSSAFPEDKCTILSPVREGVQVRVSSLS